MTTCAGVTVAKGSSRDLVRVRGRVRVKVRVRVRVRGRARVRARVRVWGWSSARDMSSKRSMPNE